MPEMQLFGLPAESINAGEVATVLYLKAEDAAGNLHDILGRHMALPWQRVVWGWGWSTFFRFYIGAVENIATTGTHAHRLYLAVQNMSGQMAITNTNIADSSILHREIFATGNLSTSPTYFELYIISANDEKIILSSGFIGGQS
jgi:hypothetical protein